MYPDREVVMYPFQHTPDSDAVLLQDVPVLSQLPDYPTGCESLSAVMLLQYLGLSITPQCFIEKYLPRRPYLRSTGPDPRRCFVGDPTDPDSMGCYAPVIAAALDWALAAEAGTACTAAETSPDSARTAADTSPGSARTVAEISPGSARAAAETSPGAESPAPEHAISIACPTSFRAIDLTGAPEETLLDQLRNRLPVIYWATLDMKAMVPGPTWLLDDGSGQTFTWRSNEHCLLLVGFDDTHLFFHDPMRAAQSPTAATRALAAQRHAEQYAMAVSVRRV